MPAKAAIRWVRPRGKGQVTIPSEFRQRLGIGEDTLLRMRLAGGTIEITPFRATHEDRLLREFDSSEIERFLREDRLDPTTAARVRRLLGG